MFTLKYGDISRGIVRIWIFAIGLESEKEGLVRPSWRYALPGVGNASWPEILHELKALKFDGVSALSWRMIIIMERPKAKNAD